MCFKIINNFLLLMALINNCKSLYASEISTVFCHKDYISVEISLNSSYGFRQAVYWSNLRDNSNNNCQASYHMNGISLKIFSKDFYKCGFGRIFNKLQKIVIYYQDLVLRQNHGDSKKIPIKCAYKIKKPIPKLKHKLMKRDELLEDFQEDEDIEILDTIQQQAAEPQVLIEVRQNDQLIDGMVTVIPGTPLVMEVKLNEETKHIYGLKVNYLEVSDTGDTSETILFRGCTVDPYLFENFNLTSNNSLKSKFRAFKFPNTSYVQFKANVEICLTRCLAPLCAIGNAEHLREKREISEDRFEVLIGLTMKVDELNGVKSDELMELEQHVNELKSKTLWFKSDMLKNFVN